MQFCHFLERYDYRLDHRLLQTYQMHHRPIVASQDKQHLSEHVHKRVPIPGWNCKFEPNSEDLRFLQGRGKSPASTTEPPPGATDVTLQYVIIRGLTGIIHCRTIRQGRDYGNGDITTRSKYCAG